MQKAILISISVLLFLTGLFFLNPFQIFTMLYVRTTGHYIPAEYETVESIRAKVLSKGVYYDRLYRIADYHSMEELSRKSFYQIPFVQIYDANKQTLTMASGNDCKWTLMKFFDEDGSPEMQAGDSTDYRFIIERLELLDVKSDKDTFDFYLLAGWANYAPKLSDSLFAQTNAIKKSGKHNVCFSYIDLDYQKEWERVVDSIQKM